MADPSEPRRSALLWRFNIQWQPSQIYIKAANIERQNETEDNPRRRRRLYFCL